jgi:hypothetical protein
MGVAALSAQLSKIIAAHYPRTQQTHAGEGCGKTRDKADTSPAMNILKLCASAGIKITENTVSVNSVQFCAAMTAPRCLSSRGPCAPRFSEIDVPRLNEGLPPTVRMRAAIEGGALPSVETFGYGGTAYRRLRNSA